MTTTGKRPGAMHNTMFALLGVVVLACFNPPISSELTTVSSTNTTVAGTVLERLDGPPCSYLRLKTDQGEVWAAVPMDSSVRRLASATTIRSRPAPFWLVGSL